MWYVNGNSTIGRITTSGSISAFNSAGISYPNSIAAGADGALWFTDQNGTIGRITTSGAVTDYDNPTTQGAAEIAAGPDGAMWFDNLWNSIGRIQVLGGGQSVTTTITSVTANPLVGQPITIGVEVAATDQSSMPAPSGVVVVSDENGESCEADLTSDSSYSASGSCQLTEPSAGNAVFGANYEGDANYESSPTLSSTQVSIGEASPTVALTPATSDPVVGQPIVFDVNVSGPYQGNWAPAPTGSVDVTDGSNTCVASIAGSLGVSIGSCSITERSTGNRSFSATYPGDSNFESAQTSEPLEMSVGKAAPTIALTLGTQNPVAGQPLTLDVKVSAPYQGSETPAPTGSVNITDGSNSCVASISGSLGVSTGFCGMTESSAGTHSLSASYAGDTSFNSSSTAQPLEVSIGKATSTTTLELSKSTVVYGKETSLVISVTVKGEFSGKPTGSVIITEAGKALCTITLVNGAGKCSLAQGTTLKVGKYAFQASYPGDTNFGSSVAKAVKLAVT